MCLNPLDPQTMRIFSTDGSFHALVRNSGGGHDEGRSAYRVVAVFDQQGGKPGANWNAGDVCPVITRGRASVADIHAVCAVKEG